MPGAAIACSAQDPAVLGKVCPHKCAQCTMNVVVVKTVGDAALRASAPQVQLHRPTQPHPWWLASPQHLPGPGAQACTASAATSSDGGCAARQASTTAASASAAASGCTADRAPSARTAAALPAAAAAMRATGAVAGLRHERVAVMIGVSAPHQERCMAPWEIQASDNWLWLTARDMPVRCVT